MSFIFVYVTNPDRKTAEKIALSLLKKRLIACANIFPVESMYWWKKNIEKTKEFVLIVKTSKDNFKEVKNEIMKIHPYKVPCIVKISVEANEEYEKWIEQEVK
jgi:periplasmic divalent cation tolerance protein